MIHFDSDYMEGCHPVILNRLVETNMMQTPGYSTDEICESARLKIRQACDTADADVEFMVGGTQTNATILRALLRPYQSVISADSGHINGHEAGAVEATGHKIITIPAVDGKLRVQDVERVVKSFRENRADYAHVTWPAAVYLSQPTELGTLYSLSELKALRDICDCYDLYLFADGARLGYGLASTHNDVSLPELARLCDAFYIGGTKIGAYFGEAAVVRHNLIPHFRTVIKQDGALLAKGRLLGVQFDTLFTDNLYTKIARRAVELADCVRSAFRELGCDFYSTSSTNQIFVIVDNKLLHQIDKIATFTYWCRIDEDRHVIRLVTSWGTREEDVNSFVNALLRLKVNARQVKLAQETITSI